MSSGDILMWTFACRYIAFVSVETEGAEKNISTEEDKK
jgi:hypothetical protein